MDGLKFIIIIRIRIESNNNNENGECWWWSYKGMTILMLHYLWYYVC